MLQNQLTELLDGYHAFWWQHHSNPFQEDGETVDKFKTLLKEERCFFRDSFPGHITASGLIVSVDFKKVLLTHHAKLDLWLQLGGHSDGDRDPYAVALRECQEESGLKSLGFWPKAYLGWTPSFPLLVDLDIHKIPERKNEPVHFHYDIRFFLTADAKEPLVKTEESKDLAWFKLEDAYDIADQPSMVRQFDKVAWLADTL